MVTVAAGEKNSKSAESVSPRASVSRQGAASGPEQGSTLVGTAYRRLLDDIVWARLEPGRKLRMHELKAQYGLGQSPLREALNRLTEGGLVIREENKGFRVCYTSAEELEELTKTRCWVEEIALRESIARGDNHWEEQLLIAHHWLSRAPRLPDASAARAADEWETRHRRFHLALIEACAAPKLVRFCAMLQDQTLRYRNVAAMKEYREQHERGEHRAIRDAVLARKTDLAVELLHAHYNATRRIVSVALRYPMDDTAKESCLGC